MSNNCEGQIPKMMGDQMAVPQSEPAAGPIQAVAAQSNILDRINQAVINISGRLEFMRKLDQKSVDEKSVWSADPNLSILTNVQAKLAYDMESVSDKLNSLYESLDV